MIVSLHGRLVARVVRSASALAIVAALAGPASAEGPDVLARVDGQDITRTEVELATEVFGEQLQQVPEAARQSIVVDALVDMHVIAEAARKAGIADSDKFKRRLDFLEAQALRNTYIEDEIQGKVTDEELKARYQKDVANYTPPEEVHARHILVKTEEEAKAVLKQLADGGDFAAIAKEKSEDPGSKEEGGDLGFFTKGQMVPEFEAEAFSLPVGEISKAPVKTQFGYHVIKVDEKRTQPVPSFEDVREQVVQVVQREKFQAVLTELKAAAKVERFDQPAEPAAPAPADATAPTPAPAQ